MERIGSDTRAYHSLASRFVWDQPNVKKDTLTRLRRLCHSDGLLSALSPRGAFSRRILQSE